jgi:hypothetical protein
MEDFANFGSHEGDSSQNGKARLAGTALEFGLPRCKCESLAQFGGPRLNKDSEWKTISQDVNVPKNAKTLVIQVAVFGPRGQFSVDDVKIIPNPA